MANTTTRPDDRDLQLRRCVSQIPGKERDSEWATDRFDVGDPRWRRRVSFAALALLSLVVMLFICYSAYNFAVGGDRNGNATSLLCIRVGNYLSVGTIILSITAKGKSRWSALLGGCFFPLFWMAQGMSL